MACQDRNARTSRLELERAIILCHLDRAALIIAYHHPINAALRDC